MPTGVESKQPRAASRSRESSAPHVAPGAASVVPASPWPRWGRVVASVLLAWHVAAVFAYPFLFATRGSNGVSPLAADLERAFGPYQELFFLKHGYAFFAPDPGPSTLVEYRVGGAGGEVARFPDAGRQQPRLFYHRHFMLAEQLNAMAVPANPPPLPPGVPMTAEEETARADFARRRRAFEAKWAAFVAHLSAKHGGRPVEIRRVVHRPPDLAEVRRGLRLDDPSLYTPLEPFSATAPTLLNPPAPPLAPEVVPVGPLLPAPETIPPGVAP